MEKFNNESIDLANDQANEESKENNEIEPILIGTDAFKEKMILSFYKDLINNLNTHLGNLEYVLIPRTPQTENKYDTREIPLSYLFGYLGAKDRLKYIREKYIERNEIIIPGISSERLTETDLLDIPELPGEELALNVFDKLKERYSLNQIDFAYPISLLYRKAENDCEENIFTETETLKDEIHEHCSTFAKTRKQKKVYDAVKNIVDSYNYLISIGVSIHKMESFVEWAIKEDITDKKFTVNKDLFSSFLLREVKNLRTSIEKSRDFNFILT